MNTPVGLQQVVGDDGVEHAHAAFVEHAHDRLLAAQLLGQRLAELAARLPGTLTFFERRDVVGLVLDVALRRASCAGCREERLVGEILAPERRVLHAGLGQRAVEIQHADQSRPGARPVGDGQDRPAVRDQPVQHVMRVLPDGLGHDQRRVGIDAGEDLHAFLLRADEAVLLGRACTAWARTSS